jgi:hypothetical protein
MGGFPDGYPRPVVDEERGRFHRHIVSGGTAMAEHLLSACLVVLVCLPQIIIFTFTVCDNTWANCTFCLGDHLHLG